MHEAEAYKEFIRLRSLFWEGEEKFRKAAIEYAGTSVKGGDDLIEVEGAILGAETIVVYGRKTMASGKMDTWSGEIKVPAFLEWLAARSSGTGSSSVP